MNIPFSLHLMKLSPQLTTHLRHKASLKRYNKTEIILCRPPQSKPEYQKQKAYKLMKTEQLPIE